MFQALGRVGKKKRVAWGLVECLKSRASEQCQECRYMGVSMLDNVGQEIKRVGYVTLVKVTQNDILIGVRNCGVPLILQEIKHFKDNRTIMLVIK